MIQYKSWNSFSPLSADAAKWAIENKHLFPVGNAELYVADYASAKDTVEIDLFDENDEVIADDDSQAQPAVESEPTAEPIADVDSTDEPSFSAMENEENLDGNDFEITAEELAGIEFVPTAQRMQTISNNGMVKGGKINFKTVLIKGLIWALIGSILGFAITEIFGAGGAKNSFVADIMGYSSLSRYYEYSEIADEAFSDAFAYFESYCAANGKSTDDSTAFAQWYLYDAPEAAQNLLDRYQEYDEMADDAFYDAYMYEFYENEDELIDTSKNIQRVGTAIWSGFIALFIGLFLGMGEGIFYGSASKAVTYASIGAGISLGLGFISGYLAQWMYATLLEDNESDLYAAIIRGLGWAIMGLGIGLAIGLIKPAGKRILFCSLGGLAGGFLGGFLFNYVFDIIPDDMIARGVAIVIMGLLIGLGVGFLEQFAKQAWLKVIRGEFEGKEYLVFSGTTSIGNTGKNTIVLFKDKLVGPHHCDIVLQGNRYVLVDCGTPMGTVVNGMRINRHNLRHGDTIAIGNSVLVFNTK
ncbi:MAG: FHA domain-containing protein [Clostridia bacterium]|nr:FHA domain-containing protein [Clostridia bacterium]